MPTFKRCPTHQITQNTQVTTFDHFPPFWGMTVWHPSAVSSPGYEESYLSHQLLDRNGGKIALETETHARIKPLKRTVELELVVIAPTVGAKEHRPIPDLQPNVVKWPPFTPDDQVNSI